jgi:hypothetical protein
MPPISYKGHLVAGIRVDSEATRNDPSMVVYDNLRCDRFGAKPFPPLTQPWSDVTLGAGKVYPSPQYFQTHTQGILAYDDAVYQVNYSDNTITQLSIKDFSDLSSAFTITGGGLWHFLDLYGTWMLFNGTSVVMRMGVSGTVYGTNDVTIKTGCTFRETRGFFGGFDPSNCYALADWPTYLADYTDTAPEGTADALEGLTGGLGRNSVWWSSWYGSDLLWLFSLTYMKLKSLTGQETGYSESDPFWRHVKRLGQSGNRVMPWPGDVVQIRELGDGVMVYGQTSSAGLMGSVVGMVPVDSSPASTFGLKRTGWPSGMGIAGRSAAGGDEYMHVAVSEEGELFTIGADMVPERRTRSGYKEIFSEYDMENITVSLDPSRRDYYITDGDNCHVLTPTGLCKAPWIPTTIYLHNGDRLAVFFDTEDPDTVILKPQVYTVSEDGVARVVHTVKYIGKGKSTHPVQFALEYRTSQQVDYTATSFVDADVDGEVRFNIACIEYRWILKCADKDDVTVDDVVVLVTDGLSRGASWPSSSTNPATE